MPYLVAVLLFCCLRSHAFMKIAPSWLFFLVKFEADNDWRCYWRPPSLVCTWQRSMYAIVNSKSLSTHGGLNNMAAILQTTYFNGFSWMKKAVFWLRLQWISFTMIWLTMRLHWLWFGAFRRQVFIHMILPMQYMRVFVSHREEYLLPSIKKWKQIKYISYFLQEITLVALNEYVDVWGFTRCTFMSFYL